jgi:hypothetical protein
MKQVIYISNAVNLMDDDELIDLLQKARIKNLELEITGVLLYSLGTFIQVIEGPKNNIDAVFKSIEHDPRHKNIIKLVDKQESKRTFPDWSMGFSPVKPYKTKELLSYLQSTDYFMKAEPENSAMLMIQIFINTNNLVISY